MSGKARILIFDDDPDILELCTIILSGRGYEVHTEQSCRTLLDTVASVSPDLIFMDNWIPDTGGIEATRSLKAHSRFRQIPVIYFSANNDVPQLAAQAGADDYINKPFDILGLEEVISRNLARSVPDR
jgi:CheY-like chemotaxis protein